MMMKFNIFRQKIDDFQRDAAVIRASKFFDARWYLENYKDLAGKKIDPAKHYLEWGAREGRDPSPYFTTEYYLEIYPDVAADGINPLVHFLLHGKDEGRSPSIKFNAGFYLALYPEIAKQPLSPLQHFLRFGRHEGRKAYFDAKWYVTEYPDATCSMSNAESHYINTGRFEGRHPYFDSDWYIFMYSYIVHETEAAWNHYVSSGRREGFHASFDEYFYMKDNPDLSELRSSPYQHYVQFGRGEGRAPAFSRQWYLTAYRDVKVTGQDPFEHYFVCGRREGRPLCGASMKITSWGAPNLCSENREPLSFPPTVPVQNLDFNPKVSIIVPNYNHGTYLSDRLESIYKQNYANYEVILLDDASTDHSRTILENYAKRYPKITKCIFNDNNSGGVFYQWKTGMKAASGELIWIAESDDYCDTNFLVEMVRFFRNSSVMLAFSRIDFVSSDGKEKVWDSESYWNEGDIRLENLPFIMSAHEIVQRAWGARNIAANVSSVLFRHPGDCELFEDPTWLQLRMCGDWIFYLFVIRGGFVGYSPLTTNYYRQHPSNTSVSMHDQDAYYTEHKAVAKFIARNYAKVEPVLVEFERLLYNHWKMKRGKDSHEIFDQLLQLDPISLGITCRKPNIAIAVYALVTGGGETFPILLANHLKKLGFAVTLLNFEKEKTNEGIRATIDSGISVVELENSADTGRILQSMGIEVVHSHHWWVDISLAFALRDFPDVAHVLTMHGMYEFVGADQVKPYEHVLRSVDKMVYIADKNLKEFSNEFFERADFQKIDNTVAIKDMSGFRRADFGLSESDFVFCLASRAVPEKGWQEAIDAVIRANEISSRPIHLLLVGDGPEQRRLSKLVLPPCIHLLGFSANVRDFFDISDMGLIASVFRGESCPLVLIECLSVGKPVVASDIAEVSRMLATPQGLAGATHRLNAWQVDIEHLAEILHSFADDPQKYENSRICAQIAFKKFEPDTVVQKYIEVYEQAIVSRRNLIVYKKPALSVVLVSYKMQRELTRTLVSLSRDYQALNERDFEIIIVENSHECDYDIEKFEKICSNFSISWMINPEVSPACALNHGISLAKGDVICVFIDAARMASPRLLSMGLQASKLSKRAVVGTLSYHLGNEPQNISVRNGYNQSAEDILLSSINWEKDGYQLFRVSSYDPSSRFGPFRCPAETNSLFMHATMWAEYCGFSEDFKSPGGGLLNLDLWRRLCEDQINAIILITGEATFHQIHGGVSTNAPVDPWSSFHDEYIKIRGRNYSVPNRIPLQIGQTSRSNFKYFDKGSVSV